MTISTSPHEASVCRHILWQTLAKALPGPISLPVLMEQQGSRSVVYRSRQEAGAEVIIKLTKERNSYPVEQWVYGEYARAGVPAPQTLYYCASLPSLECPCLVLTMIDGAPAFDTQEQHAGLFGEVGDLLGRMHAVPVLRQCFGLGAFLPSEPAELFSSWLKFITAHHAYPKSGHYLRRHGLWPDGAGDLGLLGAKIAEHRFRCVVNHGDFGPDHLLIQKGRITGVIDPGEAFVGPPEYDLAHIALYISGHQLKQVLIHYPTEPDLEMVNIYAAVIALHKAARAHRAGNVARAEKFTLIARSAFLSLDHLNARLLGGRLTLGYSPECNAELDKIQR